MTPEEEEEARLEAEVQALLSQGKKEKKVKKEKKEKKKKKKKHKSKSKSGSDSSGEEGATAVPQTPHVVAPEPVVHDYQTLLARVYMQYQRDHPDLSRFAHKGVPRLKLPPPQVFPFKTTRTCWGNFAQSCVLMNRPPDHVLKFLEQEYATNMSVNGNQQLVIPTRTTTRALVLKLEKYVSEYILCIRCKSCMTRLWKDKVRRITCVTCATCDAEYTVAPLRGMASHIALKKGDRRRARAGVKIIGAKSSKN